MPTSTAASSTGRRSRSSCTGWATCSTPPLRATGAQAMWRKPRTSCSPSSPKTPPVDGIKISLLDQRHEETFRARLPAGVRLYTGDDFNYAPPDRGDGTHHSHALLGIFAAIAPAAAQALEALARATAKPTTPLRPDGPPQPRDLPRPHAVLQGGHRLPLLAQRPPVPLHHARGLPVLARHHPLCRRLPACGPGRFAGQSRQGNRADAAPAGAARHRPGMRDDMGDRRPTIVDVASRAGVSKSTVSLVLQNSPSCATRPAPTCAASWPRSATSTTAPPPTCAAPMPA